MSGVKVEEVRQVRWGRGRIRAFERLHGWVADDVPECAYPGFTPANRHREVRCASGTTDAWYVGRPNGIYTGMQVPFRLRVDKQEITLAAKM